MHRVRRSTLHGTIDASHAGMDLIQGWVAPGFEGVKQEFERNFVARGEIGASVAAYVKGEKVVDLWGGWRTPERTEPWNEDTMVIVFSTTKGLAAMTAAVANARGWLDYDARVARYWPEFAQNGKENITVRQLLGHEAGLAFVDRRLHIDDLRDLDRLARILETQKPSWAPGTRHGYHAMSIGFYLQEIIRRVDPEHRTLGRFFREEIARPLGIDGELFIGLPKEVPDERIAKLQQLTRAGGIAAMRYTPIRTVARMIWPRSLLTRSLSFVDVDWSDRASLEIEVPAGNAVGTARAIARAYSAFAEGGVELGIGHRTFAELVEPPRFEPKRDVIIGLDAEFSLGFLRGLNGGEHAFGTPGAGGSLGFADPDLHLGYAYVMNKMDFHLIDDPREKALRDAVTRAIIEREVSTRLTA